MKKKPHWTQKTHLFRRDEYICSECGTRCERPYQICPGCGIRMKSSRYDPTWVDEAEELSAILDDDW